MDRLDHAPDVSGGCGERRANALVAVLAAACDLREALCWCQPVSRFRQKPLRDGPSLATTTADHGAKARLPVRRRALPAADYG